jgi:hypothetical protein
MYCLIDTLEAQVFGDARKGGKVQLGAHLRSSAVHILSASNSSGIILVTVPAPTGAGANAPEH